MKAGGSTIFSAAFLIITAIFIFLLSCSDSTQPATAEPESSADSVTRANVDFLKDCRILLKRAKAMDSVLLRDLDLNRETANKAIVAFTDYASYCHNDTLSPVYLIKTAQVARAIENIPQAKAVLDECIQRYPDFHNRPAALFFLAQLYDEPGYLNNEQEAAKLYQDIIDNYPSSDWALSAQGALQFIGKSDDEMLREFEKKNKKKK